VVVTLFLRAKRSVSFLYVEVLDEVDVTEAEEGDVALSAVLLAATFSSIPLGVKSVGIDLRVSSP
jgi:hypothetical protein